MKDVEQQDMQALHRVRERLMGARTALVNEIRGLLAAYGIVFPKGVNAFRKALVGKLEVEQSQLTPLSQALFSRLFEELGKLATAWASSDDKLEAMAPSHPECQRLLTIPGIGPITATALLAAGSDMSGIRNGRQFSAWVGLVPKQHSTGGETRLLGIRKRGDGYLRTLLMHGARATLRWVGMQPDRRSPWIRGLLERRGWHRTAVAVATKQARIVGAFLSRGGLYGESASESCQ